MKPASQIEAYVADYGYTLIELPPRQGDIRLYFYGILLERLIDLWTRKKVRAIWF